MRKYSAGDIFLQQQQTHGQVHEVVCGHLWGEDRVSEPVREHHPPAWNAAHTKADPVQRREQTNFSAHHPTTDRVRTPALVPISSDGRHHWVPNVPTESRYKLDKYCIEGNNLGIPVLLKKVFFPSESYKMFTEPGHMLFKLNQWRPSPAAQSPLITLQ